MSTETAPIASPSLEALAASLLARFVAAGYGQIAPDILQPAEIYLDAVGEEIRNRTYVFTDIDGDELCLRPDLTVPACRFYLDCLAVRTREARVCYHGSVFRFQPWVAGAEQPREFRQAGLEAFGHNDREAADAEILALVVDNLRAAGLEHARLRLGDVALFNAVLDGVAMPQRWRERLARAFWRTDRFREVLGQLCRAPHRLPAGIPGSLVAAIDGASREYAAECVAAHLAERGITHVGLRSVSEIADYLLEIAADARSVPLEADKAQHLLDFTEIVTSPSAAAHEISELLRSGGIDAGAALDRFARRLGHFERAGIALGDAEFAAGFGRNLEYYTGMVFQIEVPSRGRAGQLAGGGRYDGLVARVGGAGNVPAVGASIHTERLLAVIEGAAL